MRLGNNKILVVEDSDIDIEKIRRSFRKIGLEGILYRAKDGIEALEIMRGENGRERLLPPYIVLLDLNLPRMNGFEFLDAIRNDEYLGRTPVFVLSTSNRQMDIDNAYAYCVCGYISKPVGMAAMVDALERATEFWKVNELPSQKVPR